jgi:DNA-binding phage protein
MVANRTRGGHFTTKKRVRFTRFDPVDHLKTDADAINYLQARFGTILKVTHALGFNFAAKAA